MLPPPIDLTGPFTCDRIVPRLWQGSDPPKGMELYRRGVNVLVLCAEELQHDLNNFPGVAVIYAPMDDSIYKPVPIQIATPTAQKVARFHTKGSRILICCAQGRNRSGLVTALALWFLTGKSGKACVHRVQTRREDALTNPVFVRYLEGLAPRGRARAF